MTRETDGARGASPARFDGSKRRLAVHAARILCRLLGGLGVAVGAAGGEFTAVLQKAVKICLECIGIG